MTEIDLYVGESPNSMYWIAYQQRPDDPWERDLRSDQGNKTEDLGGLAGWNNTDPWTRNEAP